MDTESGIVATLRGEGAVLRDTPWGPVALDFGDWEAEYRAFRQSAGVFRPPSFGLVEITGSQRAEFLNRLTTNKLDQIQPGEGRETFLTDSNGRILHHVIVFAGPESLVLETGPGAAAGLCAHLDHYWIREDLKFIDRSADWRQLLLGGQNSAAMIERLTGVMLPAGVTPPTGDDYLASFNLSWNGKPLMVRRFHERGFQSYHLCGDAADMEPLWRTLRQLGAVACGVKALEAIRIEEGFPVIGLDITDKNLPQEVGRDEKAISFTKGCYLGQEIIARLDSRGTVSKVLSGLRFQTAEIPSGGGQLTHDGQPAGQITSATYSPGFRASVALAYIRRPLNELGVVLDSQWGKATVVELPMR